MGMARSFGNHLEMTSLEMTSSEVWPGYFPSPPTGLPPLRRFCRCGWDSRSGALGKTIREDEVDIAEIKPVILLLSSPNILLRKRHARC
jgi:hypothetical protein